MAGTLADNLVKLIAQLWAGASWRFSVFCLLLGLLAATSWPLNPLANPLLSNIRIDATGVRNPAGKSAEVWITQLPRGVDAGCLLSGASGTDNPSGKAGWERRGARLVSYTNQPATIQCTARAAPDGAIQFARSPWSGDAVITINGQSRQLHLYSASADKLVVRLADFPAGTPRRFGMLTSIISFTVTAVLLACIFTAGGLLLLRCKAPDERVAAVRKPIGWIALSLPALGVFAIVLAGTWPAQMSADSAVHWASLHKMRFNNASPPLPSVLIGLPGLLLGSIGISMMVQIIILAGAIGRLSLEVSRWNNGRIAAWASAWVTPLFPSVALLSTVFWKDIPYTAFLALLTAGFLAALRTGGKGLRPWTAQAAMAILLFLVAACRHNGLITAAVIAAALLYLFRSDLGKRGTAIILAGGLLTPLLWNNLLLPTTGRIAPVPEYYAGMLPMHLLGAMVAANEPLPQDTIAKMETILPLDAWKARYNCENASPLFFPADVNRVNLGRDLLPYAIRAALEFPRTALHHVLCMNGLNWRLSPSTRSGTTPLGIAPELFANLRQFAVDPAPVAGINAALKGLYRWSVSETLPAVLFWRPAAMQLLLLFLAGVLLLLKGYRTASWALVPIIANTLSLVPLISSQDFRYQYPIYLIGIPLAIYMLAQIIAPGEREKVVG